jgi:sphingolipid 8-(E)-desaturase
MKLWDRQEVAQAILDGQTVIVYRSNLLRIPDKWLDAHPGGSLALLHFVGRDATDEIDAYHQDDTMKLIPRYSVGQVQNTEEQPWIPFLPPVMAGWVRRRDPQGVYRWHQEASTHRPTGAGLSEVMLVPPVQSEKAFSGPTLACITPLPSELSPTIQARHSKAYKELHKRVVDAGLYATPYLTGYGPEILRYSLFAVLSIYAYWYRYFKISAFFLGLLWHQLVFAAHDLGHMGVTHNWTLDRIISIFIADYVGGLSIGWWVNVRPSLCSS